MRPRLWLAAVLLLGCTKQVQPKAAAADPADTLVKARERSIPDPVRTRLQLKVASPTLDLAGSTGGGLVIDRPGKGRLDVFGPVGGRLLTASTDGQGMSILLVSQQRLLQAQDAEVVLQELSGGVAGVDDLLAVLVGDLPLDGVEPSEVRADDQGVHVVLPGPADTSISAVLEPERAVPLSMEGHDAEGTLLLSVTYGEYERVQGRWLPSEVHLAAPAVELTLDLRYQQWAVPTEAPDVFVLDVPDDFATESLEDAVRNLALPQPE